MVDEKCDLYYGYGTLVYPEIPFVFPIDCGSEMGTRKGGSDALV